MTGFARAKWMPRVLMRIYAGVVVVIRRNRCLFRLLFGFWPPTVCKGQLWDWTTIQLRRAMARRVASGASLLDMGTGPVAVLGIWASRERGCAVLAVDHVAEVVKGAGSAVRLAGAPVKVLESSLFQAVDGLFDVIVFNAPYIDEKSGVRLGLLDSDLARKRWGGGEDGLETVERFLADAHRHLAAGGEILLGVNLFYVLDSMVRERIEVKGWRLARVWTNRMTRAAVYALRPAVEEAQRPVPLHG